MSNNLDLDQVAESQNNKEVTINDQAGQLDAALTAVGSFPVDDTNALTLTADELRRAFFVVLTPDASPPDGAITVTLPAATVRGLFAVVNTTAQTATVEITGQSETSPTVTAGTAALLSSDGTNVRAMGSGAAGDPESYDFGFSKAAIPTSEEVIGKVVVSRAITIPANMTGSVGHVDTNPTAQFDIDVTDDGVSIGTISIATNGTFTFTTAGGTSKPVAAGSVIDRARCAGAG